MLPLHDIRVVEIASFVAAPAAGALLADLGAEVIKIEVPWGEIYRHGHPRFAGYDSEFEAAPHFQMDNRGKRSLALDLTRAAAREAVTRVIDCADVVLTNMLPHRLERFETVAPPVRMSGHAMSGNRPAPALGADTAEVLGEIGLSEAEIAAALGDGS